MADPIGSKPVDVPAQPAVEGTQRPQKTAPPPDLGGENVVIQQQIDKPDLAQVDQHDIDNPPAPGVDANKATSLHDMDAASWNPTCDIYALIHNALAENAKQQNETKHEMGTYEALSVADQLHDANELAKKTAKAAKDAAIAQTIGGAVSAGVSVAGAGAAMKRSSLGNAVTGAGQSSSGLATGIQGWVDAGLQGDIKRLEGQQSLDAHIVQKNGELRGDYGQSFSKTLGAEDELRRQQGEVYNAASQAMRN